MTEPDPIAILLKFGFLAVLYLFLLWVARSALRDLRRGEDALPAGGAARHRPPDDGYASPDGDAAAPDTHPRLEVVAAKGHAPGRAFDVRAGARLGRS